MKRVITYDGDGNPIFAEEEGKEKDARKNEQKQKAESLYRILERIFERKGVIAFKENRFYSMKKFEEAILENLE